MMKKVSIIGCGWLGLPLGGFLVRNGYEVLGSTTREEKLDQLQEEGIQPFLLNVGSQISGLNWEKLFQSETLILNIPPRRRIADIETIYPKQVRTIFEAAKAGSVKQLLFVSSTGVYGNTNQVVTEEDNLTPERASGKALVVSENFLKEQKDISTTILRLAGLVGGERKAGRFLAGKKELSNAKAPVNLIHRDDCIRIIYQILQQNQWGLILNAAADEHPEKATFYKVQTAKLGLEAPTFQEQDEPSYKIISNQKLKAVLNYTFLHPDPMDF